METSMRYLRRITINSKVSTSTEFLNSFRLDVHNLEKIIRHDIGNSSYRGREIYIRALRQTRRKALVLERPLTELVSIDNCTHQIDTSTENLRVVHEQNTSRTRPGYEKDTSRTRAGHEQDTSRTRAGHE